MVSDTEFPNSRIQNSKLPDAVVKIGTVEGE